MPPHTEAPVQVTIGRIEIRATNPHKSVAVKQPASTVEGLKEYLARRGRRGL